ncbi:hypothetical protein CHARACLAT_020034 [Characodon lateralis]|uniref:Uncharacterized protein n=1 Tax=Characodon lateralis TaxID=208331 RepID=A0ABU7CZR3_9TELE|nr:hypothetical protein [Characodon lateralis]
MIGPSPGHRRITGYSDLSSMLRSDPCDSVLDSKLLFSVSMFRQVLETTPTPIFRSNREPPFLSYLQPCSSEITLGKHDIIAHLPVPWAW